MMICEEGTSSELSAEQQFRQSFDRFNEKLVENILSYLTFNEKVLFESVSKQFQRCVYNQQKQLSFFRGETEDNYSLNRLLEPIEAIDYNSATAVANGLKQINRFWLKSILKKCKSIEKVSLDCYLFWEDLDLICRNCPKLKFIEFETVGLSANDLDIIGNRYGQMFEKVNFFYSFISQKYCNKLLVHCKNLKELLSLNINEMLLEDKQYLPKLEVINSYNIDDQDKDENFKKFERICTKLSETLSELSLNIYGESKTIELDYFFNNISKLAKLKLLNLHFSNVSENEDGVDKHITKMSQNIPDLKKFHLTLNSNNCLKIDTIFKAFEVFTNLMDLGVYIYGCNENTVINGSVECLKSSKNLKSLSIDIEIIGEEFFKNIDKHLPNLSILRISCESEITDKTIFQLSNLKKLKEFCLHRFRKPNKLITDESVCALIKGCPSLEIINFGSRPNITSKTIEALISCANTYPKRKLDFWCGHFEDTEEDEAEEIPAIQMNEFADRIPENLTLTYIGNIDNQNNEE